jgi:uncharacterized protein DUF3485
MTSSDNLNRRPVVLAAVAAGLLVLIFGLTYRVLEDLLAVPLNNTAIDPVALDRFPSQIGDWTGQDVPMDEALRRATDTDALINRRYSRSNELESVWVYVACGTNAFDVMSHRPSRCYVVAGWKLVNRRSMDLALDNGTQLSCTLFRFVRGGLRAEETTVLYYCIADGQRFSEIEPLVSQARRGLQRVEYVAQVQIVVSNETQNGDAAVRLASAFAVDSASAIAQLFEDI